jgi:hypothetical protein
MAASVFANDDVSSDGETLSRDPFDEDDFDKYNEARYAYVLASQQVATREDHFRRYKEILDETRDKPVPRDELRRVIDFGLNSGILEFRISRCKPGCELDPDLQNAENAKDEIKLSTIKKN